MRRVFTLSVIALCAVAMSGIKGSAQVVGDCDWRARADAIAEPWNFNTKTYANGDVRLALLDVVEPAAGALHLLVISPPRDELGTRQCRVVSYQGDVGFAGFLFDDMIADYDPATGLTFVADVQIFDGDIYVPRILTVTLNQATGQIESRLE